MTHQPSLVRDIEIEHEGVSHRATYFIEHGIIHARIGERLLSVPLSIGDPDATVANLLRGHLAQSARRERQASRWQVPNDLY